MTKLKSIVLLRPPQVFPKGIVRAQKGVPSPALAYLSSYLKGKGIKISCIDALGESLDQLNFFEKTELIIQGLSFAEILQRLPEDLDFLGVSCNFSNEWIACSKILKEIHHKFPSCVIVLGGEHASADAQSILVELPFINACVIGEGEETLFELIKLAKVTSDFSSIHGVVTRKNGLIIKTAERPRLEAPLHFADWHSIPIENYLSQGLGMAARGKRSLPIVASRGCPYRCSFCSSHSMWKSELKVRPIENILSEITFQKKTHNIEMIEFYDMSAAIDKEWFISLCEGLKGLNLTWNFPSGIRPEILTQEVLTLMRSSGCNKITLAPESANSKLRNELNKKMKIESVLNATKAAVKTGLIVKFNIIWGLPKQTWNDLLPNLVFLFRMAIYGAHDVTCFSFVPTPGSQLFNELKFLQRIPKNEAYSLFLAQNVYNNPSRMRSWSPSFTDVQLQSLCLGSMAFFYLIQFLIRPVRAFVGVYRIIKKQPVTMLELALCQIRELAKTKTK